MGGINPTDWVQPMNEARRSLLAPFTVRPWKSSFRKLGGEFRPDLLGLFVKRMQWREEMGMTSKTFEYRVTHDRWIFTDSTVSSDVSFWKVPGFLVIFRNQPDFFSAWDGRQQLPIFWARGLQRCLAAQCAKLPQLPAKTWSKVGNFSKNSVIFERIHDNSSINGLAPVSSWFGWFCNRFNIQFEDDLGQKHYVHQRGTQGRLAHLLTWRSFFTMLSIDTLG